MSGVWEAVDKRITYNFVVQLRPRLGACVQAERRHLSVFLN